MPLNINGNIINSSIASTFTYNNIMNCLANIPNWTLYYLQQSSTKTKVVKTLQTNIVMAPEESINEAKDKTDTVIEPQQ
jgi:hypothetical protein